MVKRILFITLMFFPSLALAQFEENPSEGGVTGVYALLGEIENYLVGFVGSLAVLFIIIGGIRYIVSSGNENQVASAKKTILYAIIGLLAVIFYMVIRALIEELAGFAG